MLQPKIVRQRMVIELISEVDLKDHNLYYRFLVDLTTAIGMRMFFGPIVGDCELGPSAWVAWMESGCQVHSFLPSNLLTIDVFSCKPYKPEMVVGISKIYFKPKPENIEVF
jgi:hypothetical protein